MGHDEEEELEAATVVRMVKRGRKSNIVTLFSIWRFFL